MPALSVFEMGFWHRGCIIERIDLSLQKKIIVMGNNNTEILCGLKSLIHTTSSDARVFLYGSRARGDYHRGSDWDLLILLNKERIDKADFDNIAFPLILYGWEHDADISPKLYTVADWEKRSFTPFYKNVTADSIEL